MTVLTTSDLGDQALDEVSPVIREAYRRIASVTVGPHRLVRWNANGYVAVTASLVVDLPCEGPVDGVDIRPIEPVAFVFPPAFPDDVPSVRSDRADFPARGLPHLNPVAQGQPACFCLHRGSLADWLAEHTIEDLVERVRHWLRDAAGGLLQREFDGFEATRVVGTRCSVVLPMAKVDELADGIPAGGHAYFVSKMPILLTDESTQGGFSFEWSFSATELERWVAFCQEYNGLVLKADRIPSHLLTIGVVVWGAGVPVESYFESQPNTLSEVAALLRAAAVPFDAALAEGAASLQYVFDVPIVAGIRRPRPLIRQGGLWEWLGFLVPHRGGGALVAEMAAEALQVRRPLDLAFARHLSGDVPHPGPVVIVGCGALGSKMAMHLARSGCLPLRLVDHAALAPHNAVRHGLTSAAPGVNKAEAVQSAIAGMYPHVADLDVVADKRTIAVALGDITEGHVIVDATASTSVARTLATAGPLGCRVLRCEIAATGVLGLAATEGPSRNPRIDDLQFATYDASLSHSAISEWLVSERARAKTDSALEEIELGFGCSSDTVRCPDENVSIFAAQFTRNLRRMPEAGGRVTCISLTDNGVKTLTLDVPPVVVLESGGWQVRVSGAVVEMVDRARQRSGAAETGGLLLGYCHKVRKTVYITRALPPSRDSSGTAHRFDRGVAGMPDAIRQSLSRSGGLIGYAGEWHTHPTGSAAASRTDREAAATLARDLRGSGQPVVLLICARRGVAAHVFETGEAR